MPLENALMLAYGEAADEEEQVTKSLAMAKAFDPGQPRDSHGQWTGSAIGAAAAAVLPAVEGRWAGQFLGSRIGRIGGYLSGAGHAVENVIAKPWQLSRFGPRAAAIRIGSKVGAVGGRLVGGRIGLILGIAEGARELNNYLTEHWSNARTRCRRSCP